MSAPGEIKDEQQAPANGGDVNMTDAAQDVTDTPQPTESLPAPSSQPTTAATPQVDNNTTTTPAQSPAPTPAKQQAGAGAGGTPLRNEVVQQGGGGGTGSRAQSVLPPDQSSSTTTTTALPSQAAAHGGPVRQYLNKHVANAVLEGMKAVARERPSDPLRVLGEFLIQKSKENESKAT
ncbi:hypothetical protein GE09DRAFT_1147577 [Coniochaeta sp. 2T2.1]|nr:hypothetical protein GE09DRAFT_1147577 [Coniochaeta sp. 2T2.1]